MNDIDELNFWINLQLRSVQICMPKSTSNLDLSVVYGSNTVEYRLHSHFPIFYTPSEFSSYQDQTRREPIYEEFNIKFNIHLKTIHNLNINFKSYHTKCDQKTENYCH